MSEVTPLASTDLALPNPRRGKVRDLYDITLADGGPGLLIVATDRLSAFDVVLDTALPGKGIVLTQLSRFWFERFSGAVAHHLVSTDAADVPGVTAAERALLRGRVMICRAATPLPIECIVRGHLAGSGWRDYRRGGAVCGIPLPPGLVNGDRLPTPLFTPSTKAAAGGHDENISFDQGAALVGADTMAWLADTSLKLYREASAHALARGIVLADTKFEFGVGASGPMLIDELLTPDSSRFWPADAWHPGHDQPSFDKQFVRDHLERQREAGAWNGAAPAPPLPDAVAAQTMARYLEAFERLTGAPLDIHSPA